MKGFYIAKNFLTKEQEEMLVSLIDSVEWGSNRSGTRRIQIYGPFHDENYRVTKGRYTPHSEACKELLKILDSFTYKYIPQTTIDKMKDETKCEIFINEYFPNTGLRPHFDHRAVFDEIIIGVSLLSDAYMTLGTRRKKIPRRSLYIMSGDSRYKHKHSIKPEDLFDRRISVTLRTIK